MWWLLALALVGCIDDDLVECGDLLCPRGTACDLVHHSCVDPEQLTACADMPDFTSCQTANVAMGRCFSGVCLPAGCGNGEREPEELCDDGNTVGGDGCSADCLSRERCGDGYTDKLRGEECDDANTRGRDGCTNRCTLERPAWHLHLENEPSPRVLASAAYDSVAGHFVMFGGASNANALLDETWTLDEVGWTLATFGMPLRRTSPALAYDPQRHRVVMFGGYSTSLQGLLLNDTWEWNGATWDRRSSPSVPAGRFGSGLAWDGSRLILFGGSQTTNRLQDTWAWSGGSWTRLAPASAPSARTGHGMVFDDKHDRIVLFGGNAPAAQNDTWIWDGTDWSQLAPSVSPPLMRWLGLAYDTQRGVVVLSGVEKDTNINVVWELDGSQWVNKQVDTSPAITGDAWLAYDERIQRVVQVGGYKVMTSLPTSEVWEWDGSDWTLRGAPVLPERRYLCALASDPLRGRVVLFGGQGADTALGDTWEWDGRRWQATLGTSPTPRAGAALAFDGAELLLFGGIGSTLLADTWHYNGTRWMQVASSGPAARFGAGMAYDTKRARVVLFGGGTASVGFDDTWVWSGTAWARLTTTNTPPARTFTQLAYDIARDRIVMFGGFGADGTTQLTDTWELDGTTWTETAPSVRPEMRRRFNLVYDRARERVMLFGGSPADFSLWEWNGTEWKQPETTVVPGPLDNACATYDDARREVISFGGDAGGINHNTATGSYRGDGEEVCRAGLDLDEDGTVGCADDDCGTVCAPLCWDDPACTTAPRCGDGACSSLEAAEAACIADCP